MAELLDTYDLKGKFLGTQERDELYSEITREYFEKGKINRQVKGIRLILMNSRGRIYLQKRSRLKKYNLDLYDKTVGGHVKANETWNATVIKECSEELGFPATVVEPKEFDRMVKTVDLNTSGILKKVDEINNFQSVRIMNDGKRFMQPWISAMYVGYYDGSMKFKDCESCGIETFSLEELDEEIKRNPDKFTEDIKFMINKYRKFIKRLK
ncbi:NUDIX domain-containing protein [Candidatus Woesearchaeota archaeon]|nr:NUDIX domain-containing protein [Candidatus Woesearchaeota archaeon]